MKLKINKACDLSSISVLPPPSRRSSIAGNAPEMFGRGQNPQLRSQPSQQSFSQGFSSQHGIFSQMSQSQNSIDDNVTIDQRVIGSQDRGSSGKRMHCLPPANYNRDEGQMMISRSSSNGGICKWKSSSLADQRSQISDELERRIGGMETSLNRLGMVLESIQSDIMQVNKGTKEVLMEMEGIRQKLMANDNVLQQMSKGQEDIKSNVAGCLKSMSDQATAVTCEERLDGISSAISALPEQINLCLQALQPELCKIVNQEMQVMASSLKIPSPEHLNPPGLLEKGSSGHVTPNHVPQLKNPRMHQKVGGRATVAPTVEVGSWTSVKREQITTITYTSPSLEHRENKKASVQLDREWRVPTESDEDIDGGFSCLIEEKGTGSFSVADAKEETERILRKARRRKRRHLNTIVLN